MTTAHYPALVLNADHRPIFPLEFSPWQDSIKAAIRGAVTVVAEYEKTVRSPSTEMRIPSVIASRVYVKPQRPAFTRYNLFLRDRFRCAFCGTKHAYGGLTFDHLIPQSKGGETSWTNILAACSPCNAEKDDQHREPLWRPFEPTAYQLANAAREFPPQHLHESWLDYLYWDAELEH